MHEAWVFLVEVGFKVHRGFEADGADLFISPGGLARGILLGFLLMCD